MKFRLDEFSRMTIKYDSLIMERGERDELHSLIFNPNNWEINDYNSFLDSVDKTPDKYKPFMTPHPYEELVTPEWKTFKLKGYDAGFALHYVDKGKVDICNVHNNSNLRGISNMMLAFAKRQGGTMLDNYAGFLGDKYQKNGFKKYDNYEWNDYYRPEGWKEDLFGLPDVEMRSNALHDKRYANKLSYRNHFNAKMNKAFPGNSISIVAESRLRQIIRETISRILK